MHEMKRKAIMEHANNLNTLDYEDTVAGLKTALNIVPLKKMRMGCPRKKY